MRNTEIYNLFSEKRSQTLKWRRIQFHIGAFVMTLLL